MVKPVAPTTPWIIVGGGASGLATAFFLRQQGQASIVIERAAALGGRMGTVRLGDRSLDCGGKNIGRRYTLFRRFAASLGTHPLEYFGLNSSQAIDGRLKTLDGGARWRGLAGLAHGASWTDLARFGRLLWRVRADEAAGFLGSPLARTLAARHDARPAAAYFSPAFCERILRPMTVRMNGAEPDEVHLGTLPSNVRMLLDTYEQFSCGVAPVLRDFQDQYDVRLNTTTEGLLVTNGHVTGVRVRDANGATAEIEGAGVIVATTAHTAAALTAASFPRLCEQLRTVTYWPVTLVLAEYERPVFSSEVRAIVFGPGEALSNAGAYGVNDRHLVRYTFSGRAFRQLPADIAPHLLVEHAEALLGRHVPLAGNPRRAFVARRFSPGLCAYTARHDRFLDRLGDELRGISGLSLTGDYIQGASIEACFRAAAACVERLAHERRAA